MVNIVAIYTSNFNLYDFFLLKKNLKNICTYLIQTIKSWNFQYKYDVTLKLIVD